MNRAASRFLALMLPALGLPVRTDGFTASPAPERCWFMDDFESASSMPSRGLQYTGWPEETDLSVHAIRFYERQGLWNSPVCRDGAFRIFSGKDVRDLKFIHRAQELGFSLTDDGTPPPNRLHVPSS